MAGHHYHIWRNWGISPQDSSGVRRGNSVFLFPWSVAVSFRIAKFHCGGREEPQWTSEKFKDLPGPFPRSYQQQIIAEGEEIFPWCSCLQVAQGSLWCCFCESWSVLGWDFLVMLLPAGNCNDPLAPQGRLKQNYFICLSLSSSTHLGWKDTPLKCSVAVPSELKPYLQKRGSLKFRR